VAASAAWLAATSLPTVTQFSPNGLTVGGTTQLKLDGRTGDGKGTVTWSLQADTGWTVIGTAGSQAFAGDPLSWTSALAWDSTTTTDGAHTLRAVVVDGAGNQSQVTTAVRVDNGRPPSPTGFGAAGTPAGVALTWQQPAYANAASYLVYRDASEQPLVELGADRRAYVDASASAGSHSYRLVLQGRNGQSSQPVSASATVTAGAAPATTVSLHALLPNGAALATDATVKGRLLVEADVAATGDATFEYSSDDSTWTVVPSPATCASGSCLVDWDAGSLPAGHYSLRARSAGATSESHGINVGTIAAPLAAPTNLTAAGTGPGIRIHWAPAPGTAPAAYSVWRQSGAAWQLLGRVSGTDYLDAGAGAAGTYRVQSIDAVGLEGVPSAAVTVSDPAVQRAAGAASSLLPATPTGLRALSATGAVVLYWNPSSNASAYSIRRSLLPTGPFSQIATSASTSYVDRAGPIGSQVYYQVVATSGPASSAASASVAAMQIPAASSAGPGLIVAVGPAPVSTVLPVDLILGSATAGPVLAGGQTQVAASGAASRPVTSVRLDVQSSGGAWQPLATLSASSGSGGWTALAPVATSSLADGLYSVRAVALAGDGTTVETTAASSLQVVHGAPSAPVAQALVDGQVVDVSWTAATAALPVTYSVYRVDPTTSGYVLAASGLTGTTFQDRFLPGDVGVAYAVTATDTAGNESSFSAPAMLSTPSAWTTAPPVLSFIEPLLDGVTLAPGSTRVSIQAGSQSGIASMAMAFAPSGSSAWLGLPAPLPLPNTTGGSSLGPSSGTVWGGLWSTGSLVGSYDLRLITTDNAGNTVEQIRSVTFSGSAPRGPPAALLATAIAGGVRLTWPTAGVPTQVRRSATSETGPFELIAQTRAAGYDDFSAIYGTTYWYLLQGVDGAVSQVASASPLGISAGQSIVTPGEGGAAVTSDGTASITFAPGSFTSPMVVSVTQLTTAVRGIRALSPVFSLNAIDSSTGAGVDTFAGQPLLTIHYSPTGPAPTSIFYLDPQGNAIAVPSTVDPVAHTISATLPHFSDWVTGDLVDVALNASAATIDPGASVTLTATVTNQSDSSASPNAPVVFHTTLGTLGPASCSTDGSGVCGVTLTNGSDQGLAAVTAEVEGTFSSAVLVTFRQPINHTLTGAHVHAVELNADATHVTVTIDGVAETHPIAWVNEISITGEAGQLNSYTIDQGADANLPSGMSVTFAGGSGGVNTVKVTRHTDVTLINSKLTSGRDYTLSGIGSAELTSESGSPHLDASGFAGAVRFVLAGSFGTPTVKGNASGTSDTIDLTGSTQPFTISGNAITSFSGDAVTVDDSGGARAITDYQYDFSFAASYKAAIDGVFATIDSYVSSVQSTIQQLSNVLPLLDRSGQGAIGKIVGLVSAFDQLAAQAHAKITAFGSGLTLGALVAALNQIALSSPVSNIHLTFSAGYTTDGSTLVPAIRVSIPMATFSRQFTLDLGEQAKNLGIQLDADPSTPGVQPVQIGVTAHLAVTNLAIGIPLDTPAPYLLPGLNLAADFSISIPAVSATLNLSLLEASISLGAPVTFGGSITLATQDTDSNGKLDLSELTPSNVQVTATTTPVTIPISVSIHPGVKVGSTDLNGASATLTITIPSLFGGPSGPPDVQVAFNTSLSSGADLLSNFTNAGPNEILGMLSQITDFFASMANQQVLQTTIPFTHVTIGSALDYARAFKHEILDPLFKSGDATHPDANNDGKVDINDFNFGSIQGLLDRLSAALGLPAGTLKSDWDPAAKILTFKFSFDRQLGIGTSVDVRTTPVTTVTTTAVGDATHPAVQLVTIGNANGGTFRLTYAYPVQVQLLPTTVSTSGGLFNLLTAGTYYYEVTAVTAQGETVASSETSAVVGIGGTVNLSWNEVNGATSYRIYRGNASGAENTASTSWVFTSPSAGFTDVGDPAASTHGSPPAASSVLANESTTPLLFSDTATTIESALAALTHIGGSTGCTGSWNVCVAPAADGPPGSFTVTFRQGPIPALLIDSSGLTNDGTLQQIVVPPAAGSFWLAYPDSTGILKLSTALTNNVPAATLAAKIHDILPSGGTASVTSTTSTDPSSGTTTYFQVTLGGIAASAVKRLAAAGGFNVDFGASLGSLAGVHTTGDIIPLASLLAQATFGIDLSPSQSLDVSPATYTPGPRVDVTTTQQGGKSVTVGILRPGSVTVAAIQVVTVRSGAGGTYTLSFDSNANGSSDPGETTNAIAFDATSDTVKTRLETDIAGLSGKVTSVSEAQNPNGNLYTITLDTSLGAAPPQVGADGSQLTGRNEQQLISPANVTGGTFTLSFGGQTTADITFDSDNTVLAGSIQSALQALNIIGSTGIAVTSTTAGIVAEFEGALSGTDVGQMVDDAGLQGAQQTGQLSATANFSGSLFNAPGVVVLPTQDGTLTAKVSTRDEGSGSVSVSTVKNGTATVNEVQLVTVRAAGGSFTLSFLLGAPTGVTATPAASGTLAAGTYYYVISAVKPAGEGVASSEVSGTVAANGKVTLGWTAVAGATSYKIYRGTSPGGEDHFLTSATAGLVDTGTAGTAATPTLGTTAAISASALASAFQAALVALPNIGAGNVSVTSSGAVDGTAYTVTFAGALANTDVPSLAPNSLPVTTRTVGVAGATPHDAIQRITVPAAGSFALTFTDPTGRTAATPGLAAASTAAQIKAALLLLPNIGGTNVDVAAAGTRQFDVTFQNGLGHRPIQALVATTVTPRSEVQRLEIAGATGGSFKLGYDADNSSVIDPGEQTGAIVFNPAADISATIEAALVLLPGIGVDGAGNDNVTVAKSGDDYTIGFVGNLARINFKPFSVTDSTTLAVQNTKQSLQLLDASGGTYTLTFRFGGHTGTTGPLPSTAPANTASR